MGSESTTSWNPPDSLLPKIKYVLLAVGPMAILMSASMGPGSISSLVVAGSELGYTAVWLALISGWLAASVYYVSGKVCTLTGETPVEVVTRYTHLIVSILLFAGLLYAWYFVISVQGYLLYSTTDVLLPGLGSLLLPLVLFQILVIAAIFTGGFDIVKAVLGTLVVSLAIIFLVNTFYIGPDPASVGEGLMPTLLEPGIGQIGFAGIVGGSIGVGPVWYAYIVKDNGWGRDDLPFMAWDQVIFYGILFSVFSVGIYLSAAATLQGVEVGGELDAATSLEPIAGQLAATLFTLGLWAAVFTTIGGMSAIGAYLIGDVINNLPGEVDIELSLDNRATKALTLFGIFLSTAGISFEGQPPLEIMAAGIGLLTLVAPVTIFIFTVATLRSQDVGELTGPWYLIAALTAAFLVSLYSAYLTNQWFAVIGIVLVVAVAANTLYHEWQNTDHLAPTAD
ncbi:divalent metal cation transporter [Halobacteria archaeon AArc-dxtr1]|nr:divalent metal cation transporter [Halobacteria archaeon AArc-dxtr1]